MRPLCAASLAFRAIIACGAAALLCAVSVSSTHAQTPASAAAASAAPAQLDYHPSLGDLMTMAVQPRHTKLGLAGREGNWAYAQYELSELRNAFARVARTIPVYRNADLSTLMPAMTTSALDAVERTIRAGDAAQFGAAYARLTDTCNACHVSQDHAMIVIRVPQGNPYPDQELRPQKQKAATPPVP
jgi:hypothetical protein